MDIDIEEATAECQNCGRTFDIEISDDVRKEYIRSKAFKENEEQKRNFEFRKRKEREEEEEARNYSKTKSGKAVIILTVLAALTAGSATRNGWNLIGILALVQTVILFYAVLIGTHVIKSKSKKVYRKWVAIGVVLIVPIVVLQGIKVEPQLGTPAKEINWGDYELADKIPKVDKEKNVKVKEETDENLSIEIQVLDEDEYTAYIRKCKKKGYVIDQRRSSYEYSAFNEEGFKISLTYITDLDVEISKPMTFSDFEWPSEGPALKIPKIGTKKGKVEEDTSSHFEVYIPDKTKDYFEKYVKKCKDSGFTSDYRKDEFSFEGEYQGLISYDYEIEVDYEGFNILHVSVYKRGE